MHKANSNMLWFVNILCKIVKSTAVYFSYFVSQVLTFFCSLLFSFVLLGGLALFHPKKGTDLNIFFSATANSSHHLLLFAGSEIKHTLAKV